MGYTKMVPMWDWMRGGLGGDLSGFSSEEGSDRYGNQMGDSGST